MVFDKKLLAENLEKIPEEESGLSEKNRELRTLLLVLAGDQRVIRSLSLEDMAYLFAESTSLLSCFWGDLSYHFAESKLENDSHAGRRAV